MQTTTHIQPAQFWSGIISNTSPQGMLHMAMRHVAHKLSDMAGRSLEVDDLRVERVPLARLQICYDPEAETVGIYLLIDGDVSGETILVMCPHDAMYLADWLLETRPGATSRLDEMACSALSEFGNLALSSFLNALADLTGVPLRLSPPAVVVDMAAVIFEAVALSAATNSDELLIIKVDFVNRESSLRFGFWVLPDFAALAVEAV